MATAIAITAAPSEGNRASYVRRLRELHRELLEVIQALACTVAMHDGQEVVPRTRHLRAANLLPSPPAGAMALETLLEVLVQRQRVGVSRTDLSSAERARAAAQDLRAAAAVLHRLEPRPAGRVVAHLAALAADLHRFGCVSPARPTKT